MYKRGSFVVLAPLIWMLAAGCSPDRASEHHAVAKKLLDRIGSGVFSDASSADASALRHAPSGMVCPIPGSGAFDLEVFPQDAGNQGAYCSSVVDGVATMLVAVHYKEDTNLDAVFADAVTSSSASDKPTPWRGKGSPADASPPAGLPHFRVGRFTASVNGEARYLRISVSEARGWYLQQIVSGPISSAEAVEERAGTQWRSLLDNFKQPPAAGS